MGSKNLKAWPCAAPSVCRSMTPSASCKREGNQGRLWDNDGRKELTELGTNAMIDMMQEFGGLPTRNFQEVQFEGTSKINPEAMVTPNEHGHATCSPTRPASAAPSPAAASRTSTSSISRIVNRKEYWHASGGLEYETAYAFGPVSVWTTSMR